ncbi:pre-peptidase C-terminal domain-containing protein [Shewanella sp. D64]|nr:pre-peptidase C-terminal domain-containing protein [Shewanella sp. D64]MEC4740771.1 pre-peptidase C-terminal domain-containing protein [Shewanella sp. E94]WBJ98263.1 pre-peptidase C-terminal domain-containing protein [Shewanella sp. MTB7]
MTAGVYDKTSDLVEPTIVTVPEDDFVIVEVEFAELVPNVIFSTSSETAPDVDLRIFNGSFAKIGSSAGADSDESVSFTDLPAGTYYVVVDGYKASTPGGSDDVTVTVTSVVADEASLSSDVSVTVAEDEGEFSLTFDWDTDKNSSGILILESGDKSAMIQVPYSLVRKDDVSHITNLSDAMAAGKASRVSFDVEPNFSDEDKVYTFTAQMSAGHKVENISDEGTQEGNTITWSVTQSAASGESLSAGFDLIPTKAGDAFALKLTNELGSDLVEETIKFGVMEMVPVAMIDAPSSVTDTASITLDGSASYDGNDDALTYAWKQTGGVLVALGSTGKSVTFDAPEVDSQGTVLSFELTVSDGNGNSNTKMTSVTVTDTLNFDEGGSMGWIATLLLPLVWIRRKFQG